MKNKKNKRYLVMWIMVLVLLAVVILMNICIGSVEIKVSNVFRIMMGQGKEHISYDILWKIRLPRIVSCILLGGALSLSGFLLQIFFHNPIAGPYILGISSGAKMMVALAMVFFLRRGQVFGSATLIGVAFIGAMVSMGFVMLMAKKVDKMSMLIVSGVMIGYICSAITDFVITFADDTNIVNLHNWSKGSFSGTAWDQIKVMFIVVGITSVLVFFMAKSIGAYQMGEIYAQNAGVNIKRFRILLVLLSSILSACVTAFAGPISFVGIAVPHIMKLLLKTSKPIIVIPMSFLGGSIFCLFCDLLARTLFAPTELSISSVTALFGAPIVIAIMIRKNKRL